MRGMRRGREGGRGGFGWSRNIKARSMAEEKIGEWQKKEYLSEERIDS